MVFGVLKRLFDRSEGREPFQPLYAAIVGVARQPGWYVEGQVPDTLDGRFDMVGAVLALVLIRLEAEGEAGQVPSVMLTEIFVDDMDGQLRESGIGDIVVGKHIGRMMSALGGRLTAYRKALAEGGLEEALERNLYRGEPPSPAALGWTAGRLTDFHAALKGQPIDALLAGQLPG